MALSTSTALVSLRQPPGGATGNVTNNKDFSTVGYVDATRILAMATQPVKRARDFVEGDHWQGGDGWVGPAPKQGDEGWSEVMCLIEKAFVSRNATLEVLERHMLGVVGTEPSWGFSVRRPLKEDEDVTTEEQALIDEVEAIVTEWWNKRKCHKLFQDYVLDLGWGTRSALRLYVPSGMLTEVADETGETYLMAQAAEIEDALEMIFPDHPPPEDSTVYVNPLTQRWLGITRYKQLVNWQPVGIFIYELTYVDENGDTVVTRTDQTASVGYPFPLGGRLTLWESSREPLVSKQLVSAQKALNLALSMLPRNVVTGGFLERVLLNAQMPGTWTLDKDGNRTAFTPAKYVTGPGTTNFVSGQQYTDEEGKTHLSDPKIQWRQPSEVKPVIEAAAAAYEAILGEAKQVHILIAGEAAPSGYSREQARADHAANLGKSQSEAQPAGQWFLETALALAEVISGKVGYYTDTLKATFQCRINTGPISVEERTQNVAEVEAGTLSEESAMERNGVLDVDVEKQRINSTEEKQLKLLEKQTTVGGALVLMGYSTELASEIVGIDKKYIDKYNTENEFKATAAAKGLDEFGNTLPIGDPNSPDNPANQSPTPPVGA